MQYPLLTQSHMYMYHTYEIPFSVSKFGAKGDRLTVDSAARWASNLPLICPKLFYEPPSTFTNLRTISKIITDKTRLI